MNEPRLTPTEPTSRRRLLLSPEVLGTLLAMNVRKPGTLARLASAFRESAQHCIDGLWDALARGEPERIRDIAHRLTGASSQMGATALAAACRELGRMGAGEAAERMCELEALAGRTLAELDGVVERNAAS